MQTGVSRCGLDSAGGVIIGVQADTVFVNGHPVSVLHDPVTGHGPGEHGGPVMATCSPTVFAQGIGICRAGDLASCGHPSTGSDNVFCGW